MLLQYRLPDEESQHIRDELQRLQLLARFPQFFLKNSSARRFPNQKTINFAKYGPYLPSARKGFLLVLQSGTFNISRVIGERIYILCSFHIATERFVVQFSTEEDVADFHTSVETYLDNQLACPTDWFTPEMLRWVKAGRF